MKRILFLHSSSDLYGASKILYDTVKALQKRGFACMVCLSEEGMLADAFREMGVEVIIVNLAILRRKYYNPVGLTNRTYFLFSSLWKLGRIIRKHHIDLIYSNTTAVLIGAFAARLYRVKHLWHVHEILLQPAPLVKFIGRAIKNMADVCVVVSHEVEKHWNKVYPLHQAKMRVVHNGIDPAPFRTLGGPTLKSALGVAEDTVLIGMIGRVHYWKGQGYFLDLAHQISRKYPNVHFVMVGDAFPGYEYLYRQLEQQQSDLGITDRVTNLGFRKDIPYILSGLDLFILPSILPDPLPTVILEAMSAGKPVVATAHGGALEMVDNHITGVLIPWDDAAKAFAMMEPLIQNQRLREEMGIKGSERVQNLFSPAKFEVNLLRVIEQLYNN